VRDLADRSALYCIFPALKDSITNVEVSTHFSIVTAQSRFFLDLMRREVEESVKIALQNIELIEGLL
jgi:Na+-transporting NADH:ubiquinone oxidoreductase subunit NqrD